MNQTINLEPELGRGDIAIRLAPLPYEFPGIEASCTQVAKEVAERYINSCLWVLKPHNCGEHQQIWMPADLSVEIWDSWLDLYINLDTSLCRGSAEDLRTILVYTLDRVWAAIYVLFSDQRARDQLPSDEELEELCELVLRPPDTEEVLTPPVRHAA